MGSNPAPASFYPDVSEHSEKEMATHSKCSCLENPMDEEPGRLQSMGSQSQT